MDDCRAVVANFLTVIPAKAGIHRATDDMIRSASAGAGRKRISFLTSLSSLIEQRRQLRRQALDWGVVRVDGHSRRAAVRA